jgi:hypothetical protein
MVPGVVVCGHLAPSWFTPDMEHDGLVERARGILVERYGSLWQATIAMRLPMSGGALLIAMRRPEVDPVVSLLVHTHTGVQLPSAPLPVQVIAKPRKRTTKKV